MIIGGFNYKKDNFKNTCIFAACGVICVTLLGVSTMSFAKSTSAPDTGTLNVILDDSLYNGLLTLSSDGRGGSDIDNLYVIINGKEYPVTENGDGQLVARTAEPDGSPGIPAGVPSTDTAEAPHCTVDVNGGRIYRIIWGDTLSELALEFDSFVDELAAYNHIPNPDLIYAEDDLYLPE